MFGFARCMRSIEVQDATFAPNWAAMGELGINRGAYSFGSPDIGPDAVEDANLFYSYIIAAGPILPTDLFCLDLEASPLGQDATNTWARDWYTEFVRLLRVDGHQHKPGIYMGSAYLTNRTGSGLNQLFSWLWYPRYPSLYDYQTIFPSEFTPRPPLNSAGVTVAWEDCAWGRPPDFWQFSQHFPAQGKQLDGNLYDGTLAQLRAING